MRKKERPETEIDRIRARREVAPDQEYTAERAYADRLHADVLDTPRGRELLAHFRKHTIEKRISPDASDGALRAVEAQRTFVRDIEAAIARYREKGSQS